MNHLYQLIEPDLRTGEYELREKVLMKVLSVVPDGYMVSRITGSWVAPNAMLVVGARVQNFLTPVRRAVT